MERTGIEPVTSGLQSLTGRNDPRRLKATDPAPSHGSRPLPAAPGPHGSTTPLRDVCATTVPRRHAAPGARDPDGIILSGATEARDQPS